MTSLSSISIYILFAALSILTQNDCFSSKPPQKKLELADKVYEENIKTVQLYPFNGGQIPEIAPAVVPLSQTQPLVLEFDELFTEEADYYYIKIIHCNADWTASRLIDLEFIEQFNEFPIDDYSFSFNTYVTYTHFRINLPRVKLPGNYIVMVYRNQNEQDFVLTRRFMVFDDRVVARPTVNTSQSITGRLTNQAISFEVNYRNLPISNPLLDIKVVVRQNQRWDNALYDLKPSITREDQFTLIYDHFDLSNNFLGGNEFRFFDLTTVSFLGQNVESINKSSRPREAILFADKSRGSAAYSTFNDLNGSFRVINREFGNSDIEADYLNVNFVVESPKIDNADVYLVGAFTNWEYNDQNRLTYNQGKNGYESKLLLKQGWYNYLYVVEGENQNPYLLEGSFFNTSNLYEIFVYFRSQRLGVDQLVGYLRFLNQ